MPEARWILIVYRLPPHRTRLHAEVDRRLEPLEPVPLQRAAVLVRDTDEARAALLGLRRSIQSEGGTCLILRSSILAGAEPTRARSPRRTGSAHRSPGRRACR
jgi:hypothetical protein